MGRLYIFRVEWTEADPQVGAPTIIHPSADEFRNRYNADTRTEYGFSLAISRDGSTLAVAAPYMNHMGAVYIYSRPDGPGQDWSDITHADAVKATPAVTRPGAPASTRPARLTPPLAAAATPAPTAMSGAPRSGPRWIYPWATTGRRRTSSACRPTGG